MKRIAILGSTGSVGVNALEVIDSHDLRSGFKVVGLAANENVELMVQQARRFHPELIAMMDAKRACQLAERLRGKGIEVCSGLKGLKRVATSEVDLVVSAMAGAAGLIPTIEVIRSGNVLAIANKESLVMAGQIVMSEAKERGISILPIDSEHSAIFQCLQGHRRDQVRRLILTASGGPFYSLSLEELESVIPSEALHHPTWEMGAKVSIDSATLMNKGLEVIEAHWLFGIDISRIDVVIHPQCIIHSLVEFVDGSVMTLMSVPDMRLPIQYALTYPERLASSVPRLELAEVAKLTFQEPDKERFPCLEYAYKASRAGGTAPAVLNAANEEAVSLFLSGKIGFMDIPRMIQMVLSEYKPLRNPTLKDILKADRWAREKAKKY
jgi:1-deoxy-D-xylulose-5-phosphate reductoisomerase